MLKLHQELVIPLHKRLSLVSKSNHGHYKQPKHCLGEGLRYTKLCVSSYKTEYIAKCKKIRHTHTETIRHIIAYFSNEKSGSFLFYLSLLKFLGMKLISNQFLTPQQDWVRNRIRKELCIFLLHNTPKYLAETNTYPI